MPRDTVSSIITRLEKFAAQSDRDYLECKPSDVAALLKYAQQWRDAFDALRLVQSELNAEGKRLIEILRQYGPEIVKAVDILADQLVETERERDKYKAALEEITAERGFGLGFQMRYIACKALGIEYE